MKINRVMLAERFGWTLGYVDSLTMADYHDVLAVLEAQRKHGELERWRHK